jgi:hypothetical protein
MTGKNTAGTRTKQAEETLWEPQNAGIADKFPPESPEKSGKIMDTEKKISHTVRKKLENDSKGKGKMPGNGKRKPKKTGISFEKNSGKALKKREWDEKISQHWTKKYPDEAKKSRKRMIRMKEQQSFFCRQTTEKCRKRSRKKPKNLSSLSGKCMKNIRLTRINPAI